MMQGIARVIQRRLILCLLAPQIRLLLTIVRVYKLYLLSYLFTGRMLFLSTRNQSTEGN